VNEVFSRKAKKEADELRSKYDELEDRYENLQSEHERIREESEERTNVRISYIEEEIESMNQRVEKLATDSYAIHSEVRDIHESVTEMQVALRDIVQLYKAILTKYGFGNVDAEAAKRMAAKQAASRNGDPGDHIIDALKREQDAKQRAAALRASPPSKGRATPPSAARKGPSPAPRVSSVPSTTNALDELHRLSEGKKDAPREEPEALAERLASRSSHDDRVGRVARRDMGRKEAIDRGTEGEFTRSLPKKSVTPRGPTDGGEWEATEPPPDAGPPTKPRRPKPRLEDLLSPE
jgi:hypothetical protein